MKRVLLLMASSLYLGLFHPRYYRRIRQVEQQLDQEVSCRRQTIVFYNLSPVRTLCNSGAGKTNLVEYVMDRELAQFMPVFDSSDPRGEP